MIIKIHKTKYSTLVAICDEKLIGKIIEDKNIKINLSERFYKGEEIPEKRVVEMASGIIDHFLFDFGRNFIKVFQKIRNFQFR